MSKHLKLLSRTVMVKNNDVNEGYQKLSRIMNNEGILKQASRHRFYERPCMKRSRLCYERCKRIYNADMSRKIEFLMRKNRQDAFPR